jgi:hypothetical protein
MAIQFPFGINSLFWCEAHINQVLSAFDINLSPDEDSSSLFRYVSQTIRQKPNVVAQGNCAIEPAQLPREHTVKFKQLILAQCHNEALLGLELMGNSETNALKR